MLTLALGIGATTSIFSVIYAVALRPLPWGQADRIVAISEVRPKLPSGRATGIFPLDELRDWRDSSDALVGIAAYVTESVTLTGFDEPLRLIAMRASVDLFAVLGESASTGRVFSRQDEQEQNERIVVLSYGLARRLFGAPEDVVGKTIELDGQVHTVIGVVHSRFRFADDAVGLWRPLIWRPPEDPDSVEYVRTLLNRRETGLPIIGRLAPGASLLQAAAEGTSYVAARPDPSPLGQENRRIQLRTLRQELLDPVRGALRLLAGAVVLVLLIACVNVTSLLLTRGVGRRQELATRIALGAGRWQLARLLVAECLLLSVTGAAIGATLSGWSIALLRRLDPGQVRGLTEIGLDLPTLTFALVAAIASALAFGAVPASQIWSTAPATWLGRAAGPITGGRSWQNRMRSLLVLGEVALALVLLVAAGLLINSFLRLTSVDPGYDPRDVLTGYFAAPISKYPPGERRIGLYEDLLERVRATSGVNAAGMVSALPLHPGRLLAALSIDGRPPVTDPEDALMADLRLVTPGYFRAMGIPLVAGRLLTDRDRRDAPAVVLISERLQQSYFADEDPLGRTIQFGEIVGVVGDVRPLGLSSSPQPTLYLAFSQARPDLASIFDQMAVVAKAANPLSLVPALATQLQTVDPDIPLHDVRTMRNRLDDSVAQPRFYSVLLAIFAALAFALAVLGVYGVVSFSASQRTREVGIRVALGAQRGHVVWLVLREGLVPAALGIIIGLGASAALGRFAASLLFEIEATDPRTLALSSGLLMAAAAVASCIPAVRAASLEPVVALRDE